MNEYKTSVTGGTEACQAVHRQDDITESRLIKPGGCNIDASAFGEADDCRPIVAMADAVDLVQE